MDNMTKEMILFCMIWFPLCGVIGFIAYMLNDYFPFNLLIMIFYLPVWIFSDRMAIKYSKKRDKNEN